jgi:AraC-like DNA-binding protein
MAMGREEPWADVRINGPGYCRTRKSTEHRFRPFPDYDMWFAWSGRGQMIDGHRVHAARPGTMFCLRPQHHYVSRVDPDVEMCHCYIHFDFLDHGGRIIHPPANRLPPFLSRLSDVEFTYQLMRRIADLHQFGGASERAEAARYFQGLLLSLVRRRSSGADSPVDHEHRRRLFEVVRDVREDPARSFEVAALAQRVGYSPDYFARVFQRIYGTTPKRFFVGVRIERARGLLANTSMGIEQIAAELGYGDVFYFSRQFKQCCGVAPSRWRRRAWRQRV